MIPLSILYYIYLAFVAGFFIFAFVNVYHLIRFGMITLGSSFILFAFLIGSFLIFSVSWGYIETVNWGDSIKLLSLPQ